jgi:basic amino acid/polyamine antiporter, APA family
MGITPNNRQGHIEVLPGAPLAPEWPNGASAAHRHAGEPENPLLTAAWPDTPSSATLIGSTETMPEQTTAALSDQRSRDLAKISAVTATAIAVADMIGIGVFTSLGFQVRGIPSAFSLVMLWVVGGITALCGALSYAELAAALPRSGGEYNFLSRIYHPAVGFLAGWISATVGFAAPIALAAMAFGTYFVGAFPEFLARLPAATRELVLGLMLAWLVSLVHLTGLRQSSLFQNVSTGIKIALIVGFIVAGIAFGTPQPVSFAPTMQDLGHILSAPFAISLVFVMYSYSGWNAATYIINEVREPERSLPRSLLTAALIVLALYVALNAVFLYTTPMDKMAGQLNVAQIAGAQIFGETGGRLVAAIICIGLISAVSAMVWIGPRVTMVIGEDLPGLRLFARTTRAGVPAPAILFQLAVVTVLLFTQSFEAVIDYIQFSLTVCTFLAVLGVIVLRWTQPELKRPYRVWAYPLTPVAFLLVTGFMMYFLITQKPMQSLAGTLTMVAGLLVFAVSRRTGPGKAAVLSS